MYSLFKLNSSIVKSPLFGLGKTERFVMFISSSIPTLVALENIMVNYSRFRIHYNLHLLVHSIGINHY